jgi:GntR family transcriptional regulator
MKAEPAYRRLALALREDIELGRFAEGDRLPSEHALVRQHGVSRNTVRQALDVLSASNLVHRHQGRGTFVATRGVSHVLGDLRSFTELLRERGLAPGIDRIEIAQDEDPPLAARRFLRASSAWCITRVRTGDGRPFCLMDSWVPEHLGTAIQADVLRRRQSLYAILRDDVGAAPHEATESIRAEAATSRDAEALGIHVGSPVITIYRWTSDHRGLPVEYVRCASPGDRYEYVVKLQG